jgi:hypothetical protein
MSRASVLILVLSAAVVSPIAATCVGLNTSALFTNSSENPLAYSTCTEYQSCAGQRCTCLGAFSSNPLTCLGTVVSATCATVAQCQLHFLECVDVAYERTRLEPASSCQAPALKYHTAELLAALGGYANSTAEAGCIADTCALVANVSLQATCNPAPSVCALITTTAAPNTTTPATATVVVTTVAPTTLAATSSSPAPTVAPTTTIANRAVVLQATLRILGSSFAALLASSTLRANLYAAVRSDIAVLLRIASDYVVISNMTVGSLIVDFNVLQVDGSDVTVMAATLRAAAGNSSWITATKLVYATVSTETLVVESVSVTVLTPAPSFQTSAPLEESGSGATSTIAPFVSTVLLVTVVALSLLG